MKVPPEYPQGQYRDRSDNGPAGGSGGSIVWRILAGGLFCSIVLGVLYKLTAPFLN